MAQRKLLETINLTKSFFGNTVLKNVCFDVNYGEVMGLVGENGAGKSTLIKIITGVYRPDSGSIKFDGSEVEIPDVGTARRLGIGVVFQELSLCPNLSVAENVFVGMMPSNCVGILKRQKLYAMTEELIKKFRVRIKPKDLMGKLSVGDRQIVEILKALAAKPKLLILDEPTSSLEEKEIKALFDLIRQMKNINYSIIYISHHLNEVFEVTDRITVLRDGNKVGTYEREEISIKSLIRKMIDKDIREFFGEHWIEDKKHREVLLEARSLSKRRYYQNISFTLYRGEILGLVGIGGCGKIEVCKSIAGIMKPDSGELFVRGEKVFFNSPSDAINKKVIFLPESRKVEGLFLRDSVKNNIIASALKKIARSIFMSREKINTLVLYFMNLLHIRTTGQDQRVIYLSGGNQQKVLVSKCLAAEPDILIAMDPTRGIDVGSKAEIHRILNEIAKKGVGILLISSELDEIIAMSDRILIFVNGEIVQIISKEDFDYQKITLAMHHGV